MPGGLLFELLRLQPKLLGDRHVLFRRLCRFGHLFEFCSLHHWVRRRGSCDTDHRGSHQSAENHEKSGSIVSRCHVVYPFHFIKQQQGNQSISVKLRIAGYRTGNNAVLDRMLHQFCRGSRSQIVHNFVFVRFHCPRRNVENRRDLLG